MIVVVMGVAGAGKTLIGRMLSERLRCSFFDADDFHSAENIARMTAGTALTENEREPWLATLHSFLVRYESEKRDVVLACSALTEQFRAKLSHGVSGLRFVFLDAPPEVIRLRTVARANHFFPAALIDSQFDTLQRPHDAIVIDATEDPEVIVRTIERSLLYRGDQARSE